MNTATVTTTNVVRWHVIGFKESVYQACPGAPIQPGGCCDNCGQGIRYVVTVKATDGRVMNVGRDCAVTLEGGPELAEIRRAEREYEHEQYLKSPEYAAAQERERSRRASEAERAAKAETDQAYLLFGLRTIINGTRASDYERNVARGAETSTLKGNMGNFEDDPETMRKLSVAVFRELTPESRFVGRPQMDKIERTAVVEGFFPIETAYGRSYIQKFRTTAGEALVWFSSAGDIDKGDIGSWVRIRGTVKAHKSYNGEEQTTLTRCKVDKI